MLNHSPSPLGWKLKHILRGHNGLISRVEWSPNGKMLASPSFDSTIKLWDIKSGECCNTLKGHSGRVWAVAWSPDGKLIASGSADNTIKLWRVDTGKVNYTNPIPTVVCLSMAWSPDGQILASGGVRDDWSILLWNVGTPKSQTIEGHSGQVNSLVWSPDGQILASGSHDHTIRLWDKETAQLITILKGHASDVSSLAWSPDGRMLASGSHDHTIRLWNPQTGRTSFVLEGHTGSVNCVEFSYDGKFLASKSSDGTVRLWRCDTWEIVAVLEEATYKSLPFGLAFHPKMPILATLGEADTAIRIWNLDFDFLMNAPPTNPSSQYTNARVVLVGDSGVGKSGLSLVLTSQQFKPTESTHGRRVGEFNSQEADLGDGRKEMREILLWDLAGQTGYRLIHQLYLNELAVALIVFDARSETDPFAGVHYWSRALRQAQNLQGNSAIPLKKFLVAARADRGRVSVSPARIDSLVSELGFDGYFETSAKEGWGIEELAETIRRTIDWDALPKVISTELFQKLKVFLIQEKQAERLLSSVNDLYRAFLQTGKALESKELRDQFETCIRLVESRGLIRRFKFGKLILLQPELLDAYASAIVIAAKDEPDGLGSIAEEDVLAGRFRMPEDERIPDKEQEKLLLIATVKELFSGEIALREQTQNGSLLVFPSQFTREWPEAPDPEGKAVIFQFEGPVLNVYTTLAVRLSRSEIFKCKEMWKNAAIFTAQVGGECGIWLRHNEQGRAELSLFFKPEASEETRFQFEEYVHTHLKRRAFPESIRRRRIFVCSECGTSLTELQVQRRRSRGFDWISCNVCDLRVSLLDGEDRLKADRNSIIPQMDKAADTWCKIETAASIIQGKIETKDSDVFLAHNNYDERQVEIVAKLLKQRGLNPWLAKEQIPPGRWFQDVIQQAIPNVKSAAIIISSQGLGEWQTLELRTFIRRCLEEADIPVIPVLLPGVTEIPQKLLFLREINLVCFTKNIEEDTQALDELEWGITGKRPSR